MKEHFSIPDQMHPTSNIDRVRRHHPFRISGGLRIEPEFQTVDGMLVLSRSCGKWMRPSVYRTVSVPIPKLLRDNWFSFKDAKSKQLTELSTITGDLAAVQAEAVGHLLSGSVKAMDHVLAICVEDPGLWMTDFDGRVNYHGLCDPEKLAEQTGISVIDSLPARDISVGGSGRSLGAYPHWIMFADRDHRIATRSRLLVQLDKSMDLTFLPPSDGLDVELPPICFDTSCGLQLIDLLMAKLNGAHLTDDNGSLAVQGKSISVLLDRLNCLELDEDRTDASISELASFINEQSLETADVLCSIHHFFAAKIESFIQRVNRAQLGEETQIAVNEIIFAGRGGQNGLLQQLLSARLDGIRLTSSQEFGFSESQLKLATTCVLGLLHLDQCPASLPMVTGASAPRLLGRLTPGRPTNWRRLLVEMADYRPPAMKLRDAV